jgi:hypothetical protein
VAAALEMMAAVFLPVASVDNSVAVASAAFAVMPNFFIKIFFISADAYLPLAEVKSSSAIIAY